LWKERGTGEITLLKGIFLKNAIEDWGIKSKTKELQRELHE